MERDSVVRLLRLYRDVDEDIRFDREVRHIEPTVPENTKRDVETALAALPGSLRSVIWDRYVAGCKWEKIRRKFYYSDRQIRALSNQGLDKMGELLEESEAAKEFLKQKIRVTMRL